MKENKEIKKAKEEYEYLTGDEAERRLAYLRQKAIMDEITNLEGAREEGARTEKFEIAKKLLEIKMDIRQIEEITGLTEEEIKEINEEYCKNNIKSKK